MERVDEFSVQELSHGVGATAETHVFAVGGLEGELEYRSGSPLTKWKVVSDRVKEGRSWLVMTKTAWTRSASAAF